MSDLFGRSLLVFLLFTSFFAGFVGSCHGLGSGASTPPIRDGGFEDIGGTYWRVDPSNSIRIVYSPYKSPEEVHGGKHSALFGSSEGRLSQPLSVLSQSTISISFWYRLGDGSSLQVYLSTINGSTLLDSVTTSEAWKEYSGTAVVQSDSTLEFRGRAGSGSYLYLDDANVTVNTPIPTTPTLTVIPTTSTKTRTVSDALSILKDPVILTILWAIIAVLVGIVRLVQVRLSREGQKRIHERTKIEKSNVLEELNDLYVRGLLSRKEYLRKRATLEKKKVE
jgi:hypothetical protein